MHFIVFAFIPILVSWVLLMIKEHNQRTEDSADKRVFIVRLPKAFLVIGSILVFICITVAVVVTVLVKDSSRIWILLFALLFSLLGLSLVFASIFFKIEVDKEKDEFIYHTSFGRKYVINYSECRYKITENALHLYANKHFIVDPYSVSFEKFYNLISKRCVKTGDGRPL